MWVGGYWVGGYFLLFLGGWYLRYSMHVNVHKVCDNLTSLCTFLSGVWVGST